VPAAGRPLLAFTGGGIFFFWQVGAVVALQERVSLRDCDMARLCAARHYRLSSRHVCALTARAGPAPRTDWRQCWRVDCYVGGVRRGLEGARRAQRSRARPLPHMRVAQLLRQWRIPPCNAPQASVDLAYALTLEEDLYNRPGGLAGACRPGCARWVQTSARRLR
jgi:hypothetical protein